MDARPGTYALLLHTTTGINQVIGKRGQLTGPAGFYIYTGSAFGPGGIAARLRHHLKVVKNPHWHIDYLRQQLPVAAIWYSQDPEKREHLWSHVISQLPNAHFPMLGFGSSDCQCNSHLTYLPNAPDFIAFQQKLRVEAPTHAEVFTINYL